MEITIKTIRGIAVTNLIILGLAACTSSPAPWKQAEDPWQSKRAAEGDGVVLSDAAVSDIPLGELVTLAEPEPVAMQAPVGMQDPATPEPITPVMVQDLTPEQEVMAMPASHYAVQVYASKSVASVEAFKDSKGLENLVTVKTDRAGSIVYVLVDFYADLSSAQAAAVELETKTGTKPWVRSVAGLQKVVSL
jgi:septal ring-binding cell division protein DamX